jgi:hypothetical protein
MGSGFPGRHSQCLPVTLKPTHLSCFLPSAWRVAAVPILHEEKQKTFFCLHCLCRQICFRPNSLTQTVDTVVIGSLASSAYVLNNFNTQCSAHSSLVKRFQVSLLDEKEPPHSVNFGKMLVESFQCQTPAIFLSRLL